MATVLFRQPTRGEGRFIRQQGSPGRYGHVVLVVEPGQMAGLSFSWEVGEADVPQKYEAAIERGVRALLETEGPLQDLRESLRVCIVGGSHHETDSNETAYFMAAAAAFKDAAARAAGDNAA
jgi:elongation factor G